MNLVMRRSPSPLRLFEQHRGPMVRYLRRRLGDDAAEDAAVDVFAQAANPRPADDRAVAPRPWLYSIATGVISERWRTERSRLEAVEWLARQPRVPHPALTPLRRLDPRIATAIRGLAAAERETLLLVAWGELDHDDVAATLGVSVATVRARLISVSEQVQSAVPALTPGVSGSSVSNPVHGLPELLAVLGDNADIGLDHVRQPRIESAVNHRFSSPSARTRTSAGGPQPIGA